MSCYGYEMDWIHKMIGITLETLWLLCMIVIVIGAVFLVIGFLLLVIAQIIKWIKKIKEMIK